MSPRSITDIAVRDAPVLRTDDTVETAVRRVVEASVPALAVVDDRGRFAGIFGEREFMGALFPGYLDHLRHISFLSSSLDEVLEKREECRGEGIGRYMTTEHVEVGPDYSDTQVAEIFLHHRVLVVPVVDEGGVVGLITRGAFFATLAERFLQRPA